MASVVWYWAKKGGVVHGPMSWDELRAAARGGDFGPEDCVWSPGYGGQWQDASSILETVFASIRAEKEASGPAESTGGGKADSASAESAPATDASAQPSAGSMPRQFPAGGADCRENSPFFENLADGRPPETPRSLRSLGTAWENTRRLLGNPFSLRRYCAFAFCAFLVFLGGQSAGSFQTFRIPGLPSPARQISGVSESASGGVDGLASFAEKWSAAPSQATADPEAFLSDFATALQSSGAALRSWMAELPRHPAAFLLAILLFSAVAAMHAWFLSRGWALMIHRVYRRDEPVVRTWLDTTISARRLFRGAFAVRLLAFAAWSAAFWKCAAVLSSMAVGTPPRAETLWAAFAPVALVAVADSIVTALLRDLVAPRVVLTGSSFSDGAKSAVSEFGFWTVRHLLLLGVVASGAAVLAAFVLRPFVAFAPFAFPVLASLALAPYQLLRSLWALDLFFRLHPEARGNVPPRMVLPPGIPPLRPGR